MHPISISIQLFIQSPICLYPSHSKLNSLNYFFFFKNKTFITWTQGDSFFSNLKIIQIINAPLKVINSEWVSFMYYYFILGTLWSQQQKLKVKRRHNKNHKTWVLPLTSYTKLGGSVFWFVFKMGIIILFLEFKMGKEMRLIHRL